MKSRKTQEADLENYKGLFLIVGLVVTLAVCYGAIQYRSYEGDLMDLGQLDALEDDEIVPVTQRQQAPPPPPPPKPPEIIQVVEDEVEIEEVEFESTETDETEEVEFIEEVEEETDEIFNFAVVENKPVYPGCENEATEQEKFQCFQLSIMKFIQKNFQYPEMARQLQIQGKVYISFVIEKDGKVSNVEVARSVDKMLDDQAVALIKKLPKFTPAKQRGKSVRMSYTVPINFRLQ